MDEVRGSPSPSRQAGPAEPFHDAAKLEMPYESDEANVPNEANERIELTSSESGGSGEELPQNVDEKESVAVPQPRRSELPPWRSHLHVALCCTPIYKVRATH